MSAFLAILTLAVLLATFRVAHGLLLGPAWPLPRPWRRLLLGLFFAAALLLPTLGILTRRHPLPGIRPLAMLAWLWLGALFYALLALLAGDLLLLPATLLRALRRLVRRPRTGSGHRAEPPPDGDRRLFLARARALGAVAVTGAVLPPGLDAALYDLEVVELATPLPLLPPPLEGYRVVQICDLHLGAVLGREFCTRVANRVQALRPDLVVVTGDVVDGSPRQLRDAVAPLAGIRARDGTWLVTGNHECYSGPRRWLQAFQELDLPVLANRRVRVGGGPGQPSFDLAGVHDASGFSFGIPPRYREALGDRDPDRALLLLAHQPQQVRFAARFQVGLQLSGHTHGGQCWPFGYLTATRQPYLSGLHEHVPGTWIYVSRGTGFWGPPLRVGAPAEITVHHLVPV